MQISGLSMVIGRSMVPLVLLTWLTPPVPASEVAQPLAIQPFFYALSVRDAEASAAWYARVLGFELARSMDLQEHGVRIRLLERRDALLELVESSSGRDLSELEPSVERRHELYGVFKIGFLVDDLDAAVDALAGHHVPLRGRVIEESDGSMRSLQIEDPDGNVLQLFELTGGGDSPGER